MKESISKGMDDFLTWLGDSINEPDRPDLEDFQDYVTYKKLSILSPSESQSVVDNEETKKYCLCGEPTRDLDGNIVDPYSECSGCCDNTIGSGR